MTTTASRLPILIDGNDPKPYIIVSASILGLQRNLVELNFRFWVNQLRLEDPDSEETKEFVQKQVELTQSVLKECDDTRGKLADKITKLFDHPRYDPPFRRGNKYFYSHNTGLQAQNVLYVQVGL